MDQRERAVDDGRGRFSPDTGSWTSRRAFLAGSSALAVSGLAGCLGGGSETTSELDPDDPPEKPDSITVRAWGGVWQESLAAAIGDPFTEETGIDVVYDNSDIQVTQNNIRSAVDQGQAPPVNVNWTVLVFMHREYLQGLAEPLHPDVVPHTEEMRELARPDVDGRLPYIGLYPYTYALGYNEEVLESIQGDPEPVTSWETLWDDVYEGWLGMYNDPPADGFLPVLAELADVDLGPADEMEPLWDLVEDLAPNLGYLGSDSSILQNLQEGEIAYAAGYLPSNLLAAQNEGVPVGWTIPDEGATVRTDCMYTPKNQPLSERYWSQVFIDFALRAENQAQWMEGLQMPMLNENVDPLDWMADDPAFPTAESDFDALIAPDLDVYAEHSPDWFDRISQTLE
ncbi:Spermidine/putrescine-binding periplasmic protein [Halanaeroarchaeum sp. HSR-CO]|uniref:extracellular solute-binding protein n=1 Tax=Halanaeroarchaeum sp. HSR-CO TaxID=2866382 RepID=UPI00217DA83E|nr:extracellular solute-binding protein [Halanaeroarchaeum sp. HSR-CO]UWG47527.1 Spermidine/putrescine-binding periplasmic protein [Halanaeroarchaeum sp. HSR-CO]